MAKDLNIDLSPLPFDAYCINFIVSNWHIVGANLPGVHDQFSVGCADGGAQARSSQAHARVKSFPKTTKALCFINRATLTLLWVRATKDLFACWEAVMLEAVCWTRPTSMSSHTSFAKMQKWISRQSPSLTGLGWCHQRTAHQTPLDSKCVCFYRSLFCFLKSATMLGGRSSAPNNYMGGGGGGEVKQVNCSRNIICAPPIIEESTFIDLEMWARSCTPNWHKSHDSGPFLWWKLPPAKRAIFSCPLLCPHKLVSDETLRMRAGKTIDHRVPWRSFVCMWTFETNFTALRHTRMLVRTHEILKQFTQMYTRTITTHTACADWVHNFNECVPTKKTMIVCLQPQWLFFVFIEVAHSFITHCTNLRSSLLSDERQLL